MPDGPESRIPPALAASARRRARWSYIALAAITALLIGLTLLRESTETFVNPRFLRAADGLHLFVDEVLPDASADSTTTRHFRVADNGAMQEQATLVPAAHLPYGDAMIAFAGRAASVTRGGSTWSINLAVDWDVGEALLAGEDDVWLVGLKGETFMAARVRPSAVAAAAAGAKLAPEEAVEVGPLAANVSEYQALLVGGRPAVSYVIDPDVAAVLLTAGAPPARLEGPLNRAAVIVADGETLFLTHRWILERFGKLMLYAVGTERRAPIVLEDPRLMGRRVTGIAVAPVEGGWLVVLSRSTSIQCFSAKLEGGTLVATGGLTTIREIPPWKLVAGTVLPPILLVGAIAVITLGRALYRDRREILARVLQVKLPPQVYAGAVDRSFAYAIDILLLTPVITILLEYVGIAFSPRLGVDALIAVGGVAAVQFAYFFVMELAVGQSVGKRIIGIRVQREDGRRVGFVGALVRNLVRIVDATCPMAVIGFFMVAFSARRQRLGDLLGRTVVVPVPPPEERPQETP